MSKETSPHRSLSKWFRKHFTKHYLPESGFSRETCSFRSQSLTQDSPQKTRTVSMSPRYLSGTKSRNSQGNYEFVMGCSVCGTRAIEEACYTYHFSPPRICPSHKVPLSSLKDPDSGAYTRIISCNSASPHSSPSRTLKNFKLIESTNDFDLDFEKPFKYQNGGDQKEILYKEFSPPQKVGLTPLNYEEKRLYSQSPVRNSTAEYYIKEEERTRVVTRRAEYSNRQKGFYRTMLRNSKSGELIPEEYEELSHNNSEPVISSKEIVSQIQKDSKYPKASSPQKSRGSGEFVCHFSVDPEELKSKPISKREVTARRNPPKRNTSYKEDTSSASKQYSYAERNSRKSPEKQPNYLNKSESRKNPLWEYPKTSGEEKPLSPKELSPESSKQSASKQLLKNFLSSSYQKSPPKPILKGERSRIPAGGKRPPKQVPSLEASERPLSAEVRNEKQTNLENSLEFFSEKNTFVEMDSESKREYQQEIAMFHGEDLPETQDLLMQPTTPKPTEGPPMHPGQFINPYESETPQINADLDSEYSKQPSYSPKTVQNLINELYLSQTDQEEHQEKSQYTPSLGSSLKKSMDWQNLFSKPSPPPMRESSTNIYDSPSRTSNQSRSYQLVQGNFSGEGTPRTPHDSLHLQRSIEAKLSRDFDAEEIPETSEEIKAVPTQPPPSSPPFKSENPPESPENMSFENKEAQDYSDISMSKIQHEAEYYSENTLMSALQSDQEKSFTRQPQESDFVSFDGKNQVEEFSEQTLETRFVKVSDKKEAAKHSISQIDPSLIRVIQNMLEQPQEYKRQLHIREFHKLQEESAIKIQRAFRNFKAKNITPKRLKENSQQTEKIPFLELLGGMHSDKSERIMKALLLIGSWSELLESKGLDFSLF